KLALSVQSNPPGWSDLSVQYPKSCASNSPVGIVSLKKTLGDGHSAAFARTRSEQKESASCHCSAARASWKRKNSMFAWRYSAECWRGGHMGCPPKTWSVLADTTTTATRTPRWTFRPIFIGLTPLDCSDGIVSGLILNAGTEDDKSHTRQHLRHLTHCR